MYFLEPREKKHYESPNETTIFESIETKHNIPTNRSEKPWRNLYELT